MAGGGGRVQRGAGGHHIVHQKHWPTDQPVTAARVQLESTLHLGKAGRATLAFGGFGRAATLQQVRAIGMTGVPCHSFRQQSCLIEPTFHHAGPM